MKNSKSIGDKGEDIACKYLSRINYSIICRKFRCNSGEIDIICRDREVIVFIEVKTRSSVKCGRPYEAINRHKCLKMLRASKIFVTRLNFPDDVVCRFDAISIILNKNSSRYTLKHFVDIL